MQSLKFLIILSLTINILAHNIKLQESIVKVHRESDSATVCFIGVDEEFLIDFSKAELSIPIFTFDADFKDKFAQINNIVIVFEVPKKGRNCSKILQNLFENIKVRKHNSTFREIGSSNQSKEDYFKSLFNNNIDISMNSYLPRPNLDLSYPVSTEDFVIMVPVNGFLSPHEYFKRPFQTTVWITIAVFIVYIIGIKVLMEKITTSRVNIWSNFSNTYLILLNLSTEKPIVSNYRFYLLVFLFAFIIRNLFGAYFQSFLTVFIKIKQFDTVQDLVNNNISIMCTYFQWDLIQNKSYPKGLKEIIQPANLRKFSSEFMSMRNTNFAFVADEDRCQFFIDFQSLFRKSLFRRAKEAICRHHFGYLLPPNSPFKEILNDFIIDIKQTGLLQKWDSDVVYQAKLQGFGSMIYKDNSLYEETFVPLTLHRIQFAWTVLIVGWGISIVVFINECVFEKALFLKL
ncbi:uncharacterized protein LOC129912648 [Episyrphus balteatus]|uniref:uncharacterized protein LOC129912648 n=1 Tax=Episyrphus balteatus TaxID=286459 RepID=UPI002484F453|nr:uncharacterized protein LOC129912648 [Episyrphus balteatus]